MCSKGSSTTTYMNYYFYPVDSLDSDEQSLCCTSKPSSPFFMTRYTSYFPAHISKSEVHFIVRMFGKYMFRVVVTASLQYICVVGEREGKKKGLRVDKALKATCLVPKHILHSAPPLVALCLGH